MYLRHFRMIHRSFNKLQLETKIETLISKLDHAILSILPWSFSEWCRLGIAIPSRRFLLGAVLWSQSSQSAHCISHYTCRKNSFVQKLKLAFFKFLLDNYIVWIVPIIIDCSKWCIFFQGLKNIRKTQNTSIILTHCSIIYFHHFGDVYYFYSFVCVCALFISQHGG